MTVATQGKGLYPFTRLVNDWVAKQDNNAGALVVFIQHTSCSLLIQENADPDVVLDLRDFFESLVPESGQGYRHTMEGPDDMTSHIRSALTNTSLTIPVIAGKLAWYLAGNIRFRAPRYATPAPSCSAADWMTTAARQSRIKFP